MKQGNFNIYDQIFNAKAFEKQVDVRLIEYSKAMKINNSDVEFCQEKLL